MTRVALGVALALAIGCRDSERTAPPPTGAGRAPQAASAPGDPPPQQPLAIRIAEGKLWLGQRSLAALRPAEAPGALDENWRPTYAYPELRDALQPAELYTVEVAADATLASLRGVVASLPPEPAKIELKLADGRAIELQHGDARPWTAIDLPDTDQAGRLHVAANPADHVPVKLGLEYDPCLTPPAGMACIPGGGAVVGYERGLPEEAPLRQVVISTFYIDKHETTIAEYDACTAAGACRRRINGHQNIMKPFVGAKQPAMPMDFHRARAYCAWAGKRLPTEWEWEKAARGRDGDLFPWGNEAPTCERAHFRECAPYGCTPYPGKKYRWDCNEHATKPVGSYPAGHYGLFDMAGNGYEWTSTAGVELVADCGGKCSGRDPLGPCDGAVPCNGRRILKGGSWYWPKHRTRGSHRRVEKEYTGSHRLGMRCAATGPFLTRFPAWHTTKARAAPSDPTELSKEHAALARGIDQDPIEDKPICGAKVREEWGPLQAKGGRSTTTCRDPFPYLMSNEPRAYHWVPYVENLGGAYLGIGSDQNYSVIAVARSRFAWVMDYDPRVANHHERLRALVVASETPQAFVDRFAPGSERKSLGILREAFKGHPKSAQLRRGFAATRGELHPYFQGQARRSKVAHDFGWLRNPEHYAYIRQLMSQGRLIPIKGDLLGGRSMQSVVKAARELGEPIRIFYTSNAPSSWGGEVTLPFRQNVGALPFDHLSLVLQTNSKGGFRQSGKWHYSVTWGHEFQRRIALRGFDSIPKLQEGRIPGHHGDVTVLGLPSD